MVFESVVTDVLNRVLGNYVENLDSKQLKLGIWGGDVVLNNLVLKQTALNDLDLPIQIAYGHLGKLVLQIPWKNLYGAPVQASIENLYLLVVPNQQVVYDPEKEEKKAQDAKQAEIEKVELAKKKEAEKDKPKTDDTFVEKLTAQVIKNVQLKISNIHIRYEDKVTNAGSPFAWGITLSNLAMQTTDETWNPAIVQEAVTKIYKILSMEGLAFYWNSSTVTYGNLQTVDIIHHLTNEIATKSSQPENYRYILGPINSSARLRLNPKPEIDDPQFSIPKIHLNVDMEKLAIGISKAQYHDIIALAESMERMTRGIPYRKYRPHVSEYKGHYKEWWHFAYTCVLEDYVRRKRRNWDWEHISQHRALCRHYGELYQTKLQSKKVAADVQNKLAECEKKLDILNIVLIRKRIELEVSRLGQLQESVQKKSWFSGWWGGSAGADQKDLSETTAIMKQFEAAMTPDEKQRLYRAIDYQENTAPAEYPQAYVDTTATFILRKLEIELRDDESTKPRVLFAELSGVKCRLDTRPAASAIKVAVNIDMLTTFGMEQNEFIPQLITSKARTDNSVFVDVLFETNPLGENYDQRIHVTVEPLQVVYDAVTIIKIVDIFKMPSSTTALDQISSAAESSLNNMKEKSALGLQYAIEKHTRIDLMVDLHAPIVIVPYGGKYTGVEHAVIINLGRINIVTAGKDLSVKHVRSMHARGAKEEDILKEMMSQSYDEFVLDLTELQVILANGGEDWESYIKQTESTKMHILNPVNLHLIFSKCLISDDPRLPLNKITGELPSIDLNITDTRLLLLLGLVLSIPLPAEDLPEQRPLTRQKSRTSSLMLLRYAEMQDKAKHTKEKLDKPEKKHDQFIQFTTMDIKFVMSEFVLNLNHQKNPEAPVVKLAKFKVNSLEVDLVQQTFNTSITVRLASIDLDQYREKDTLHMISSPHFTEKNQYLFKVNFMQIDKKSPEFHSKYRSCESLLNLEFDSLNVVLHQEGLQYLVKYANDIQLEVDALSAKKQRDHIASADSGMFKRQLSTISDTLIGGTGKSSTAVTKSKKSSAKSVVIETIIFKVCAQLHELTIEFVTDQNAISLWAIKGITSEVIIKKPYTQIIAKLTDLIVKDLNPNSIHTKILTVSDDYALHAQVVLYNLEKDAPESKVDMSVEVSLGCLRIVFLNWFVSNMMDFLNKFQAAQDTIIEASAAAAQSAKENMQNAYIKATKISLNIDLKAPDIVVPVDSKSFHAILLDMGHVTLTNSFLHLDVRNVEHSAVIDEMKMNLTDFKLSRIELNKEHQTIKECALLEPLTFVLSVRRNLSTSWYRSVPDLHVSGQIKTIKMLLTQGDYRMIMSILNGNLAEGKPAESVKPPLQPTDSDASTVKVETQTSKTSQSVIAVESHSFVPHVVEKHLETIVEKDHDEKKVANPTVHVVLRFTFAMESFVIDLFTSEQKQRSKAHTFVSHPEKNGLARFSLEGLSIKGRILSDNSVTVALLLVNCFLDDMRKEREGKLNRFIERTVTEMDTSDAKESSSESLTARRSMIDVTFQQNDDDIFADIRVYSFTLILSVDYLLRIADFFTSGQPKAEEPKVAARTNKQLSSRLKSSQVVQEKQMQMTINMKIEKPDIILVEHMDNIDTNALILNSEILFNMRVAGTHQVISGNVKDLQLYTCAYNPAKRAETRGDILYPVSISVAGSTPECQGLHVEVILTEVHIRVSPDTIELLNRVAITLATSGVETGADENDLMDYSDLWDFLPYKDNDFWFLKADVGDDALALLGSNSNFDPSFSLNSSTQLKELCIVSMPSFVLTLEAGVGNKTLPMLLMESTFQGNVNDWSSQMSIEASLTLQMDYYNSELALWEPLIESVEVVKHKKTEYVPWELKLELVMNERDDTVTSPTEDEQQPDVQLQPMMSINVSSVNNLELTVTKSALEVLNNLGKAFANAMKTTEVKKAEFLSPYVVKNETGIPITLCLDKSAFLICGNENSEQVTLESSAQVPLRLKPSLELNITHHLKGESSTKMQVKDHFLHIRVHDMNCELALPVVRADKRFFLLNYRAHHKDNWGLISAVKVEDGVLIITLRSILQVHNHFNAPIEVYYMTVKGNELESIAIIEPNATVNLPLKAVYTPTNELFFSVAGYSVTTNPFIWKDLQLNLAVTKMLQCAPLNREPLTEPFVIKAVGETEQVYYENTTRHTMASTCYNIHLHPAVTVKNCLPVDILCGGQYVVGEIVIKPGETLQLPNVEPGVAYIVIRLPEYLEKEWSCRREIQANPPEFSVWQFDSHDSEAKMTLDLGMHVLDKNGSFIMSLYCPFWMLNKTGLTIIYRKSKKTEKREASGSPTKHSDENLNIMHHPANFKGPILFSFNAKNFFGKKKVCIKVEQGEWSDKFSLDVAGSSGVVVCKQNDMIYQIGVHNQLTYNGLTKQVTFTPYYVIINNAHFAIECQELDRPADPWTSVEPNSCTSLWPKSERDDKLLKLRIVGTEEISAPFLFSESHTTLLKLKNKYGGVNVDIQMTEGAVYINLAVYESGMAPALIINHTKDTMNFWEKHSVQLRKLHPGHKFLYTWENPSGPRILVWEIGNKKEMEDDLRKDDVGEFSPTENSIVYWISFLDGMQRVLLFTTDKSVAENAQSAKQFEVIQQEINVSIHGLGLSLVNNVICQEIMYIGIASSGIIWEYCKSNSKRFKQMNEKDSTLIEQAYQRYMAQAEATFSAENCAHAVIDNKMEVNFDTLEMLKPHKRKIRRTFMTGLWVQIKSSPSQLQVHAKVNRLQIDNQMYDCIFPVVLAPVPPPKSVAADFVHKPFAEISIVQMLIKHSQIRQFKYFKILIQEFHVKVDLGFINALMEVLQGAEFTEQEEKEQFLTDLKLVDEPLYTHVASQSLQEQKSFYDLLHFSPLKIHVSFSLASGSSGQSIAATPNFLNVLLQGLGVTLTDMNDVIFKLAYFEREYTFLTQRQLVSEASRHYVGQLVKQLYVLVLGLDVIGNPYGLVLGITKGVEDLFYEPFQGAIQGPGEFAEGLVLGVRSLFGHTVGGAAGAVSRITGAMGKGIAALTFDKDYQRKRRDQINKTPASVQEGIARGGKGLVMGVYDGVTGVFTKPITGAKEQGVEGFFTGLGKGAVGLITRPTAGIIDFASGSLEAVKRAAELGEEANRLRPPRFIHSDNHIRPFNHLEAEGHKLLTDLEKGKYATTDRYNHHYNIIPKREILLLTDKRIAYIIHNDIFGGWQVEWSYTWQEIQNPPKILPKGICITTSDTKKKKLGLFSSNDNGKLVLIANPDLREEIYEKIESLRGQS